MKKIKGFTLLELIIVMAILAILMTAIIQMFKPIRETYVDSTFYEARRTTQNGIVTYISESVRFSTDLGIYTKDKVTNADGAVKAFTTAYMTANGADPTDSTLYNSVLDKMKKEAEIIIIDNSDYEYRNKTYRGRLLRRKNIGTTLIATEPEAADLTKNSVRDYWRLAMGAAYYGDSSYTILLMDPDPAGTPEWTASEGIRIQVNTLNKTGTATIKNEGLIMCRNQSTDEHGVSKAGMFDTANYNPTSVIAPGSKVYMVFTNEKIEIS